MIKVVVVGAGESGQVIKSSEAQVPEVDVKANIGDAERQVLVC